MSGKFRAPAALLLAFILIVSPFRALGAAEATPGDEPLNASELFTETEDGNISSSGPAMETEIQAIQPFAAVSQSITYNVYYYRPNGNYNDWLLSTWPDGDSASPMDRNYVSLDDFPGWAKYTYEVADDKINFIFHKNNTDPWEKDTEINRSIDASGQTEVNVFIISGDTTVYTSLYTYNLHYIRDDNAFTDWQANIWSANIGGKSYNFTSTAETNGQTGLVSFTTVDSEAIFFIHQAGNAGGTRDPAGNESITLSLTPDGVNGGSGDFYIESGSTAVYAVDPRSFNSFNVYYYRSGNYNGSNGGWNAWYWDYDANGDGADSAYFKDGVINSEGWSKITISSTAANLGLILKDGAIDGTKTIDGANRKLSLPSNQTSGDFYLVEGDNTVYSSKPSAVNRVVSAIAVTAQKVEAALNIDPSGLNASDFELFDVNADTKVAASVQIALYNNIGKKLVVFDTASNLDPDTRYEVRYTNPASIAPGIVTMRGILNSYTAPDYTKLGLSKSGMNWVFNLWAPSVKDVDIVIYDKPLADAYTSAGKLPEDYYTSNITGTPIEMSLDETANVWTASSADNLAGKYYMYRITHLDGSVTYAVDPYARATAPNGQLTYIVDMDSDPDVNPAASADASGFTVTNPTDAIIYELHVRDFSIHSSSGVSDTNKGLYKAFTETGTQTAGSKATGIDHLKELGVTYVQLQPVFDFGSVNELGDLSYNAPNAFNWGYDPQNYNVPEGSYSTDPSDPQARVDEFKGMINALHAAGIRVVMDVVFNHTYDVANGPFDKIVPSYFYRMKNDGVLTDGSGCGNEIATENAMVRKYIIDSIKYWETEYGIDGFRFDLMKLIDIDTMKAIRAAVKPATLIYGEPWGGFVDPFEITGTDKSNIAGTGIGAFNDDFRGAIKGKSDDNTKGFVTEKLDEEGAIFSGVYGSVNSFAGQSSESINYVTAHDNLNLWDKIRYSFGTSLSDIKSDPYVDLNGVTETDFFRQSGSGNAALQSSILSTGIIMLSEGIPFFQAGDEFLRSKKGDHNSYKSSDEINAIDWSLKDRYFSVFTYYKNLINLRKDHPAFRMNDRDDINSSIQVIKQDKNVVAYKLINNANGDDWNTIYVLFNGGTGEIDVDLGVSGLNAAANRVEVASDKSAVIEATAVGSAYRTYPRSLDVLYDSSTPQTMHHVLINPRTAERIDGDPATGPSVTGYNPLDNTPLELLAGETLPLSVN
ncbi:MAG: type I pullulanase, partial [Clostridiales bacterium]|nr:type I pullulanase [Clostridiales bacterium]